MSGCFAVLFLGVQKYWCLEMLLSWCLDVLVYFSNILLIHFQIIPVRGAMENECSKAGFKGMTTSILKVPMMKMIQSILKVPTMKMIQRH